MHFFAEPPLGADVESGSDGTKISITTLPSYLFARCTSGARHGISGIIGSGTTAQ